MSVTYQDLQTQIATELSRDDLTTSIQTAILAAIRHYQRKLLLFAQETQSISTVAGTAEYAVATDFIALDFVQIAVNTGTYTLEQSLYEELATIDTSGHRGDPSKVAYRDYLLRFYPVPDAVYTVTAFYWKALTAPSGGSDSTGWTNDLLDLIRFRAKSDLAANMLRDDAGAQQYKAQEFDILDGVIAQRDRVLAIGRVVPTEF
jgi:hypothetical protein